MHVIPELAEELGLQHCRFPASPRQHVEDGAHDVITIFKDDAGVTYLGNFEFQKDLVLAAWAILLRSYLRNDIVTFVECSDEKACPFENQTCGVTSLPDTGVRVLQFQLDDECQLKDVHAAAHWISTEQASKAVHINTAVTLLMRSSLTDGMGNGHLVRPTSFQVSRYALCLNAARRPFDMSISYQRPMISTAYAHAIAGTFRKIVHDLILNRECKIGDLDFVSDEDQRSMLSWNPKVPYGQMNCMHYLVEATARVIPCSEAVCAWDGSLSYAQLEQLSSDAARLLIQTGVGPGIFVPFAYEKSMWTVVATLAILKAGGAFVPLDPLHPKARLEETLSSIRASIIVTSDKFASTFAGLVEHVVVISAATASTCQVNELHNLTPVPTCPNDPIFVLFTSGSTGKPKGIVHEHGAICTHAITHGEAMRYHGARVLQFAAHTFDVAIIDIFTTLIYGGVVCIPSEEDRRTDIVSVINSMRVDYAILTPSFVGLIRPSEVPTLQTLAVGGEALPQEHVETWAGKVSLIQIYGPAEVGICLTMRMHPNQTRSETVGHTLRNSSCWLVDPDDPHRLVPIGAVGELVVAGPSLARGYLDDEAKTGARFIDNLVWAQTLELTCQRFHLTGDLLRFNTSSFDGSYDFVGRKDSQIKLRGQRVEPGEVEHHVTHISGVAHSVIARPKCGCFAGELVAIVQMRGAKSNIPLILDEPISLSLGQSLSIGYLRTYLSKSLPGYMIPTACLVITRMPFVPSLKIDRKLVDKWLADMKSRPTKIASIMAHDLQASRLDAKEVTAIEISDEVADLVAVHDGVKRQMLENHDFQLQRAGIDSIQIITISMFLQKRYGVKVPVHTLLSSRVTIRDLASVIDQPSLLTQEHIAIDVHLESDRLSKGLLRDIGIHSSDKDVKRRVQIQNILLTGATGYLGSRILQQLMARPSVQVFALVRCLTEPIGLQRIIDTATENGWWHETFHSRIHVWQGDLTEPELGLNHEQLQHLRGINIPKNRDIHAIIHNGARVHYSFDYETLKPFNVSPTLELLEATALNSSISTLVYVSGGQKPNHSPQTSISSTPHSPLHPPNGYATSKAISDYIVHYCALHPSFQQTRLCTIKPGYIIGPASTGLANTRDFLWRLVAACVESGVYNADEAAHWLFVADTGRVARSVVDGVFGNWPSGHVERVLDGLPFADLWALLRDEIGYTLEAVEYETWMDRLRASVAERQEGHGLFPLLHVLERDGGDVGEAMAEGTWADEVGASERVAEVKEAVRRNVEYLIQVGLLPKGTKPRINGGGVMLR